MTAQSPAQELVGALLNGRWRLRRLLGEGGMGAVYEADGPPGVGKRAIKMLHQEFVKEELILGRFFAEAMATRNFAHPNVAQVLETATAEDGTPYLVMELLQGTPVSSYTDQAQALPQAQAVHIVHGVLQALSAAHARGLVHRDIKPDNLFLVNDTNGSFHVKVLDFGIAKVMDIAGGMGTKTRTGVLLGTPGYMSPEQIKDSKGVDARADLWSVGIIFYEILTGSSPFPADNEFARLTAVLTEEVTPIEQVAPHYASWGPFFQRALAKEPAYRFQSADEMAAALLHASHASRGPSMRPPSTLQGAQPQPDWRKPQERRSVTPAPGVIQTAAMPIIAERPSAAGSSPVSSALATMPTPPMSMPMMSPGAGYPPVQQPVAALAATQLAPPVQAQAQSGVIQSPAMSRGSTPPPRAQTIASTPPPEMPSHLVAGGVSVSPTHVSAQAPAGTPAYRATTPSISVVDPGPRPAGMAPYWVVGLVAFVAFGLGLALGILING